jgi:hypothetical protein
MTEIEKLEVTHNIAAAELGLIEELRTIIATLGTIVINDHLIHSVPISIVIGFIAYMAIPYWHSKQYNETRDAVERASCTGKYYRPTSTNEND